MKARKNLIFAPWFWFVLFTGTTLYAQSVSQREWGKLKNGEPVQLFTLNCEKVSVEIATYGAQMVSLKVPDEKGVITNLILGHPDLASAENGAVLGAVIGRYANRISGGGFEIDGKRYDLESVNPKTNIQIHGGKTGFQKQNWQIEEDPESVGFQKHPTSVTLKYFSPDGHEGFPGNLTTWVQYRLSKGDPAKGSGRWELGVFVPEATLEMEFRAISDKTTHVNLTNHAYFNLRGSGTIAEHQFYCYMEKVLEFDSQKIPTGKFIPVSELGGVNRMPGDGLPLYDLNPENPGFLPFDHCFVVNHHSPGQETDFGRLLLYDDHEVRYSIRMSTNQPGVQIYTANHFSGNPFPKYGAICFETQHYPDTPNHPDFPTTLLRPGEQLREQTTYHLSSYRGFEF